jgi:hypothetical protein
MNRYGENRRKQFQASSSLLDLTPHLKKLSSCPIQVFFWSQPQSEPGFPVTRRRTRPVCAFQ